MTKPKLPRARQLTPVQVVRAQKAYLLAFEEVPNCQITDALALAGITLRQLEKWRADDQEFADLERQVKDQRADDRLRAVIDDYIALRDKDIVKAAMKRLPEYNPTKKTELEVNGMVTHEHLTKKSDDELEAIIRAGLVMDADFEVVDAKQIPDSQETTSSK
jgi:hypothetical protein